MKLASYRMGRETGYGVVEGDGETARIIPVSGSFAERHPTIRAVLAADALGELASLTNGQSATVSQDQITFLPPLHDAGQMICIGVNYPKRHPVEGDIPPPEFITTFLKSRGAIVGHREPLSFPRGEPGNTYDYEGELVLVIGKGGRYIPKEKAFDHIAGYTIMNDGSVRGWQKHSVNAGKNFRRSGSSGPWMVTADEISEPSAMELTTKLNGETVQNTTVAKMIFDIPTMVNYVSEIFDLAPGDIISTGSPEGSGGSRIPQRFLKVGDELEITWSGVGTLRNKVVAGEA